MKEQTKTIPESTKAWGIPKTTSPMAVSTVFTMAVSAWASNAFPRMVPKETRDGVITPGRAAGSEGA
jgi:hypothetical protein